MSRMPAITLDTLGRLAAHGHGLNGWCLECSARYRPAAMAAERVLAGFDVDMAQLIAERGADAAIVGLRPLPCPRCGSARTEIRLRVLASWMDKSDKESGPISRSWGSFERAKPECVTSRRSWEA